MGNAVLLDPKSPRRPIPHDPGLEQGLRVVSTMLCLNHYASQAVSHMSNPNIPESQTSAESGESFGSILSQFERSHTSKSAEGLREGTVVSVSSDSVVVDLGFKTEGALPLSEFQNDRDAVKPGDKLRSRSKVATL